ncbi:MAG: DNA-directed RNA polymerase subunit D [Candidatus Woesearchaeota archaeon]
MNIKLLNKEDENRAEFFVTGVDITYLNALRRIMESRVPTMAIDDVEIRKNNSIFYDEMIALRLGLLPLTTDIKSYNLSEECSCKGVGCNSCTLKLTLKAKGPGYVYAKQIKSKDPKVIPVYPNTPILKLLENQDVELECTAKLGRGINHSKWNAGLVFYRQAVNIEIKKIDDPERIKRVCPTHVFEVKEGKLIAENVDKCILCDACVDESNGNVIISPKDEYFFTVESWGQITLKELGVQAIKEFNNLLDELTETFKSISDEE